MIILRQKQYAAQDLAGATTAKQVANIKQNRGILSAFERMGHRRNQRWLGRQQAKVAKLGLNEKEAAVVNQNLLETYNKRNDTMRGRATTKLNVINKVSQNPINSGNGTYSKITTKDTPTATYMKNNPTAPATTAKLNPQTTAITTTKPQIQNPAQKQGMSTAGKVAIGAGVAAAGYGAYRLLKARKERKEAEEEQENKQRRQA